MDRRRFLAALATGASLSPLAGCLGAGGGADRTTTAGTDAGRPPPTSRPTNSPTPESGGVGGAGTAAGVGDGADDGDLGAILDADLPVPTSELRRGASKDAIPAITDPAFAPDWSGVDATLDASDRVIGVTADGEARAYPLAVLNWHEIVNDDFGGPLLVTYCPLCGSGVVADRTVDGEATTFGVSGYLWHSDLVMYDRATDSLWSQLLARAINGPATGASLSLRPSTLAAWGEWREANPDSAILLPPPASTTVSGTASRNYDRDPYVGYEDSRRVGLGGSSADDRLHPKTEVVGVTSDGTARAYPITAVLNADGVVNDVVGDTHVVVATTPGGSLVAYDRTVDGELLTVEAEGDHLVAGESRWDPVSGEAVDGPHEGTTLSRANRRSPMFWFAWADFYPDTEIYGEAD
jgi:hypothetical protein